jgi:hypothetical protein
MRFQVPQFIEVEDKIFGPFTFKQFVYLLGGAGLCYVLYVLLPFFIAVFAIMPVAGLSLALAFYKVNNKPFVSVLEAGIRYLINPKLYIWKKEQVYEAPAKKQIAASGPGALSGVPKLSGDKLRSISWELDVKKIQQKENENQQYDQ